MNLDLFISDIADHSKVTVVSMVVSVSQDVL